jgi:hypothetical protein
MGYLGHRPLPEAISGAFSGSLFLGAELFPAGHAAARPPCLRNLSPKRIVCHEKRSIFKVLGCHFPFDER